MKMGWTGLESAGKSQLMAVHAEKIYRRNVKWIKKRNKLGLEFVPRTMAFDSPMSKEFITRIENWGMRYLFFRDLEEILPLDETDIFINEINKFFPARGSDGLTRDQAEFLSQGAKDGVDIYFCSQDFSQCHKQFRFLVNEMYKVTKVFGSRRPCKSSPPVNYIWGLVLYWSLEPSSFQGETAGMTVTGINRLIPSFYWINRRDTELYDTSYKVIGSKPVPLKLVERELWYLDDDMNILYKKKKWVAK